METNIEGVEWIKLAQHRSCGGDPFENGKEHPVP